MNWPEAAVQIVGTLVGGSLLRTWLRGRQRSEQPPDDDAPIALSAHRRKRA